MRLEMPLARCLVACALALLAAPAAGQARRALVVGIDRYDQAPLARPAPERSWVNLDGAVADATAVQEVLVQRYGFAPRDVTLLTDAQASREGILGALRTLLAASRPGDAALFYYAGHGSRVANPESAEADRQDETLVPWDARSGARDIADKELGAVLEEAARRGVVVTAILDSCHSGSATRGTGKLRQLAPDPGQVRHDPSAPHPERFGALTFSAAQDYQSAAETRDEHGAARGAFTASLVRVLRRVPPGTSADAIFQATREELRARGFFQEPVLEGAAERLRRPLLGLAARGGSGRTAVAVVSVDAAARRVVLRAGIAAGIGPGTTFVRPAGAPGGTPAKLVVETVTGLTTSEARPEPPGAALGPLAPGALYELEKLAPPAAATLRVWLGPAAPDDLATALAGLAPLAAAPGVVWVDDPAALRPTHEIVWSGGGWLLRGPGRAEVALGRNPTAEAVRQALAKLPPDGSRAAPCDERPCLAVRVPPSRKLVEALRTGASAHDAIARVTDEAAAEYLLVGRASATAGGGVEYAWVRTVLPPAACVDASGATVEAAGADACRARGGAIKVLNAAPPATLPPRSSWVLAGADLAGATARLDELAVRIARVNAFLKLQGPEEEDAFPYRLQLRAPGGAEAVAGGKLPYGKYRLELSAPPDAPLAGVAPRRVYVLAVQSDGAIHLLYPASNVENLYPRPGQAPERVYELQNRSIAVGAPPGVDTLVLLTSDEAIPNLDVLEQDEVYLSGEPAGGKRRSGSTALSEFLLGQAGRTRGFGVAATAGWSVLRAEFATGP